MYPVCTGYFLCSAKGVLVLAGMIQFRFNADYVQRFDSLAARLGLNRTQVIRNLLSNDTILIDMIEEKAKTLQQITIEDVFGAKEGTPSIITIRLNKVFEERFNDLAAGLGINRVQVLRNLLSGDEILVSGVCKKAKTIKVRSLDAVKNEQNPSCQQPVNNIAVESFSTSQEHQKHQDGINLFSKFYGENEHTQSPLRRGRKKKILSDIDHSEERRLIIAHLNKMTGKNFGLDTKESLTAIDKMLEEGKKLDEFIRIIDNMVSVWLDDPKMNVRLCPETLFRPRHWEKYLNANSSSNGDIKQTGLKKKNDKYENFYL